MAYRYQLDEETQQRLRASAPRTAREDIAFLLKHPRLIPRAARVGILGALNAVRADPTLGWLKAVDKVRAHAPDAVLGAEWGGVDTFVALVKRHTNSEDSCVEIGCGGGRITRLVRPLVGELTAMDVSEEMLEEGRRGAGDRVRYQVVKGFGDNLPPSAYSVAVSHDVFVHFDFDDIGVYLANLHRSLRPEGRLIVSVCTLDSEAEQQQYRVDLAKSAGHARRVRMFPRSAFETLFAAMGFEVIEAVRSNPKEYAGKRLSGHLNYVLRRT